MSIQPKRITDHFTLWVRWRWFLLGSAFCAALLTFIVASLLPKTYRSTATILPPYEGGSALPFIEGLSIDLLGKSEISATSLATLLKSRTLKDRVQARIDLQKHYESDDLELAYRAFDNHLNIELESEAGFGALNIIAFQIHIEDYDPQFAADLVNVVVDEWDKLCVEINRQSASLRRQFLEDNLKHTNQDLMAVEDSLRFFQETHGIASIDAQVSGTVTTAVFLEDKLSEARLKVAVMEKLLKPGHPDLQRARLELQGLLAQERKLLIADNDMGIILPLNTAPELGLAISRWLRQIKTLEIIKQIMVQQFEQAKMRELRVTPELRIVDYGRVPLHKYKPKRLFLALIASLGALFLALLYAYFKDYSGRVHGTEEAGWLEEITHHLRQDRQRLTGWRNSSKK